MHLWNIFKPKKRNNWEPVPHHFVKSAPLRATLHEEGLAVQPFLSPDQLLALRRLYEQEHQLENSDQGGMFYSVYSQDTPYRRRVHEAIQAILQPALDALLTDYRTVLNSFIIKMNGPASEFALHQVTTGLDETQYSSLSLWIPLEDITEQNGALCVVKRSHHLFSPYRSISFPPPYAGIKHTIKDYLEPVFMKAGEALLFDNRLLHYSLPNRSDHNRVIVMCGIFPQEAPVVTCFKSPGDPRIELIQHEDDFMINYPNFFVDCHQKPTVGQTIGYVADTYGPMTEKAFLRACREHGIQKTNYLRNALSQGYLQGEPVLEKTAR